MAVPRLLPWQLIAKWLQEAGLSHQDAIEVTELVAQKARRANYEIILRRKD